MSKPFKLAIVRARHDRNFQPIPDAACIEMLMTGQRSLLRYWEDTTGGYFDFINSAMKPWVDMTINPAATDRVSVATAAFAALRATYPNPNPLAGINGAVVIVHPGQITKNGKVEFFDGGSNPNVEGVPVSVLPVMSSDHTFMCHELGHTLGFDHTFGLENNGIDWNLTGAHGPEYGSPYDLMSSASFGTFQSEPWPKYSASPTFVGPAVTDWPFAGATGMGPHLSRANLHRWFPDALEPNHVVHRPFPAVGEVGHLRLRAVGVEGTTLLILHPPGEPPSGVGRIYVEYRGTHGWDEGMEVSGPDLARAGIAIHTLDPIPSGAAPRVWFRGMIACGSVDTDFQLLTQPIVIALKAFNDEPSIGWADIQYRIISADRLISITLENSSEDVVGGRKLRDETTPCGDVLAFGTWFTSTFCKYRVATTGFGGAAVPLRPPTINWTVAGKPLLGANGNVTVPFGGVDFTLDYAIDPVSFELSLTSRSGERYTTQVVATANEAGGGGSASATVEFNAPGYYDGYTPEDEAKLIKCLGEQLKKKFPKRIPIRWRFVRPKPDPKFEINFERWRNRALDMVKSAQIDLESERALTQLINLQGPHR